MSKALFSFIFHIASVVSEHAKWRLVWWSGGGQDAWTRKRSRKLDPVLIIMQPTYAHTDSGLGTANARKIKQRAGEVERREGWCTNLSLLQCKKKKIKKVWSRGKDLKLKLNEYIKTSTSWTIYSSLISPEVASKLQQSSDISTHMFQHVFSAVRCIFWVKIQDLLWWLPPDIEWINLFSHHDITDIKYLIWDAINWQNKEPLCCLRLSDMIYKLGLDL